MTPTECSIITGAVLPVSSICDGLARDTHGSLPTLRRSPWEGVDALTLDAMRATVNGSRERLLDRGARELEAEELLAILFGGADANRDVVAGASRWIDGGGLAMVGLRPEDILGNGLHSVEAGAVLAAALELARRVTELPAAEVIHGPADVATIAHRELDGLRRERVLVIVCDAVNRRLRTVVVSEGAIDRSLMPVPEILNAVLRWDGSAFAIAHNHPCGDPEPSGADIAATRRLAAAARVVGLRFLGHVVVGGRRWADVAT